MTSQKHLKARIRARMQKTGERYSVARRQVLQKATPSITTGPERFHVPGNVPATTALRVLLSASGIQPSAGSLPLSEAMLFGIAGGVGAGVFAFRYEKEDFSSFFVAGRHLWQDDLAYLRTACDRMGVQVQVQETGGAKTAEKQLRDALAHSAPLVAWVDMAALPRHVSPLCVAGGQYHVITIYGVDDANSVAIIGDLADASDRISLESLSRARSRIKKQKNRLLWVTAAPDSFDLTKAVAGGIAACHDTLIGRGAIKPPGGKSMASNFTLEAFRRWGERMHACSDKQSWAKMFPRGVHLWRGLTSVYSFIHYGTGGGLTRHLYAEFFRDAHRDLGSSSLNELSHVYEQLGIDWDDLADAALPDDIDLFRRFKELTIEHAELTLSVSENSADQLNQVLQEMHDLEESAARDFPLTDAQCEALRARLQERIFALHRDEVAAHQRLGAVAL
jgi:hypothetical protein